MTRTPVPRRAAWLTALTLLAAAGTAGAQDAVLARVETLLATGRLTEARATLERWNQEHPESSAVDPDVRAHALLLAARVAVDADAAEGALLAVALGYPRSPHAPEALLRLGQARATAADVAGPGSQDALRAVGYLERLVTDYPGHALRPQALVWLARAHAAAGRAEQACRTARDAELAAADHADLAAFARDERARLCTGTTANTDIPRAAPPPAATGGFTVQTAAMRERGRAEALASTLRRAGFDARVARLEGSELFRVRIGRFQTATDAETEARRVRSAGHDAVVVDDVRRER
jgi:tetratricopeptide (TPR) repeat protein